MKAPNLEYQRPDSVDAAIDLLKGSDGLVKVLAGGQSLGPMLNFRVVAPSLLVDVSRLDELSGAELVNGDLVLGAAVRHAMIEDGKVPDVTNGLMAHVAGRIAYRAVRNRGTIGGSFAHADPAGDWAPVLMALDAAAVLRSQSSARDVAAGEFVVGPLTTVLAADEIVCSLRIPKLFGDARWGHCKLCIKPSEFAEALAVVVIDPKRELAHAVVTSPRHQPVYLPETEALIKNQPAWSADLASDIKAAAAADLAKHGLVGDDAYELQLHKVAVARAAEGALA